MIIFYFENQKISKQFNYIIKTFSQIYHLSYMINSYQNVDAPDDSAMVISYGTSIPPWQNNHIHIYESKYFGEGYLTKRSLPKLPIGRYNDLPVLYQGRSGVNEPFVYGRDNKIIINIDVIASSFFMLTRYEEVVNDSTEILDQHDRFPATASIAYKENFLNRPLVNEYFELLWNCIKMLSPGLQRKPLWNGKDFALCLTHDVDSIRKYKPFSELLTLGSLVLKQRKPQKAISSLADYLQVALHKKNDPYDTFDQILSLENKYGASSSFYFMTEPDYSGGYQLNSKKTLKIIERLKAANAEVGLHSGYYSYNNLGVFQEQKNNFTSTVNEKSPGCRQHFLRWKTPDTWRIQEKCGIAYDATLCYADYEGFRAGICHPFQPFDLLENRILNIWEIPLTIMDGTLSNYRNVAPIEGLSIVESYIETVKKYGGVMVLLWHNSFFDPDSYPGWTNIYENILACAAQEGALLTNARDILKIYQPQRV
jgi:peptidoglycan/xylan/chitin deacetylase (PgdA/CDA1 family)